MVYDVKTKTTAQITNGNIQANYNSEPAVRGDYVAWGDCYNGEAAVRLYDGQGVKTIAKSNEAYAKGPIITQDKKAVYSIKENGQIGYFSYNPRSDKTKQLTLDEYNKKIAEK